MKKEEDLVVRKDRPYEEIWNAFLEVKDEFLKRFEYGPLQICGMAGGYEHFIDYMDWMRPDQATSWRTDMLQVIPCPHCQNDYGLLEHTLGLCIKCKKLFNFNKAFEHIREVSKLVDVAESQLFMNSFIYSAELREYYRIYTIEEFKDGMLKEKFFGPMTFKFINEQVVDKLGAEATQEKFISLYENNVLTLFDDRYEDCYEDDGITPCPLKWDYEEGNIRLKEILYTIKEIQKKEESSWVESAYTYLLKMVPEPLADPEILETKDNVRFIPDISRTNATVVRNVPTDNAIDTAELPSDNADQLTE